MLRHAGHGSPQQQSPVFLWHPGVAQALAEGVPQVVHAKPTEPTGGYEETDCRLFRPAEVATAAEASLERNDSWLARLGSSDEAVRLHLASARRGASFLLIYAPHDIDAERAMNVVRRGAFEFVHRYHRLAIEDMT